MTTNIWANCSSLLYTFFSSNSLYIFIIHFLCQICQNTPNWIFTPRQRDTLSFSYPYPGAPYGRCISPKDQTYNLSCKKIILCALWFQPCQFLSSLVLPGWTWFNGMLGPKAWVMGATAMCLWWPLRWQMHVWQWHKVFCKSSMQHLNSFLTRSPTDERGLELFWVG